MMIELINKLRIVPVVAINDSAKAADLAAALVESGLPIAEITLRTPASLDSIKIAAANKDLLVGAGSLRNAEDLKKAVDAGARFAVSAGFSPFFAAEAARLGIPYFPGVATPTEMLAAINEGITTLKFFPAQTLGGVSALNAMSAPFPGISFMPTGGISATNAKEYLDLNCVVAVGGSWMVASKLIDDADFTTIMKLAKEAVGVCAK
jgi:2-dehydro-3-deoxyphosphogluconate aldolase/(4S)-4-hydroxy-2-oxoglutarate aldolase